MKKLITSLLGLVLLIANAQGQVEEKPYKWMPIPNAVLQYSKAYIDINGINTDKTDTGQMINTATLLLVYDEPLSVYLKSGETKSGSSVVSNVIINCTTGIGAPINDFLLADKMPTKKSIPIASREYRPSAETMFRLSKDDPIRIALCPLEI